MRSGWKSRTRFRPFSDAPCRFPGNPDGFPTVQISAPRTRRWRLAVHPSCQIRSRPVLIRDRAHIRIEASSVVSRPTSKLVRRPGASPALVLLTKPAPASPRPLLSPASTEWRGTHWLARTCDTPEGAPPYGSTGTSDRRLQPTYSLFKTEHPRLVRLPSSPGEPGLSMDTPSHGRDTRFGGPAVLDRIAIHDPSNQPTEPLTPRHLHGFGIPPDSSTPSVEDARP